MNRILQKDKPKIDIVESMLKAFWKKNPKCNKAVVSIKEDKLTRSAKQNRLLWLWYEVIAKDTFQPAKDVFEDGVWVKGLHTLFKEEYLPKQFYDDGTQKEPSTKGLSTSDFKNYLEQIDHGMATMGIILPRPEDLYYESMGYK